MSTRLLPCFVLVMVCALAPQAGRASELPVVVVRGLALEDLDRLESRGAVGLLVPDAGPKTSEARARASLVRGEVVNFLRGELPSGRPLIETSDADSVPLGPAIVLGLPSGGEQPNDRRYPIAVLGAGYTGLLTSDSTRISGLVSIVDVAPTSLGADGALGSRAESDAAAELRDLDARIVDNGDARLPASLLAAALIVFLALVRPRAALLAFATGLGTNLALGLAGVSSPWIVIPAIGLGVLGALPLSRAVRSPLAVGVVLAGTLVAYLTTLGLDAAAVALSPFGPTQNARFYGISNLLETMLLPPALGAGALLGRRLGPWALGAVAVVALVAVAGSRFGADGGGAIVLAAGFAILAVGLGGPGRRSLALGAASAALAIALVAVDAALGPTTHVGRSIRGGPDEIAGDLVDRVELSWERVTSSWGAALLFAVAMTVLLARVARMRDVRAHDGRAVLLAYAAALAVSLVVNDSPSDIAASGVVGYLALERFSPAGALERSGQG